jgi:hypothetical protein
MRRRRRRWTAISYRVGCAATRSPLAAGLARPSSLSIGAAPDQEQSDPLAAACWAMSPIPFW